MTRALAIAIVELLSLIALLPNCYDHVVSIGEILLTTAAGTVREELPILRPADQNALVHISLRAVQGEGILQITPDDCFERITQNGVILELAAPCRSAAVTTTAAPGNIDVWVRNTHGGPVGLGVQGDFRLRPLSSAGAVGLALLLLLQLGYLLRLTVAGAGACIAGFVARLWYLWETDLYTRSYDLVPPGGHIDYMRYILAHGERPNPLLGWEYHQPPLYYYVLAGVHRLLGGTMPGGRDLQLLSLFCSLIFLVIGVACIQRIAPAGWQRSLAMFVFAIFPSAVIHATRVGNDALVYPLAALVFLLLLDSRSNRAFKVFFAAVSAAIAFAAKATALPLLLTVGLVALWRRQRATLLGSILLGGCVVLAAFPLSSISPREATAGFTGSSLQSLHPNLRSEPLFAPACINPLSYFNTPFLSSWDHSTGSACFAPTFLKTMLFAEFDFPALYTLRIAYLLLAAGTLLWLAVLVNLACPAVRGPGRVEAIFLFSHLAVQLAYYQAVQISPAADFRYALPVLIPLCGATARMLNVVQRKAP